MRILLTVGNLAHMRSTVIPKLVGLFKLAYKCNMDEDLKVRKLHLYTSIVTYFELNTYPNFVVFSLTHIDFD